MADLFPDRDALARLCRRHHIRRLSLFGSVGKGTSRPDSDVDLLVEFEPGLAPGLLALAGIEGELSRLLEGRRVDLRTPADLSRHFRSDVLATAVPFWTGSCTAAPGPAFR
ncbi:MAG: nucleotidyltransferase family protein [Geminicoccaceae bacterium]